MAVDRTTGPAIDETADGGAAATPSGQSGSRRIGGNYSRFVGLMKLVLPAIAGVLIGVLLSILWLIYVSATPAMPVLAREPGTQVFRSFERYSDGETQPGVLVVRFDAGLYFASSGAFEDGLREMFRTADPKPHTIVISFEAVSFIDSQGSAQLSSILDLAEVRNVDVRLARVHPDILEVLRKDNVIDQLGEENIYGNIYRAVMAGDSDAT